MSPCQSAFLRVTESHVTAGGSPSGTGRGSSRSLRQPSPFKEGETEAGSWVREQIGARNSHLWAPSRLSGGHPLKAYFTPGSYLLHDISGGGKEGGVPSSVPASGTPALPQGSWTDRSRAHLLPRDRLGGRREAGQAVAPAGGGEAVSGLELGGCSQRIISTFVPLQSFLTFAFF